MKCHAGGQMSLAPSWVRPILVRKTSWGFVEKAADAIATNPTPSYVLEMPF